MMQPATESQCNKWWLAGQGGDKGPSKEAAAATSSKSKKSSQPAAERGDHQPAERSRE